MGWVGEFASCNKMQEQHASLQPSIDWLTSQKNLASKKLQSKRNKQTKWRKWKKQTHEIAFFAPFETLGTFFTPFWKHLQPYIENWTTTWKSRNNHLEINNNIQTSIKCCLHFAYPQTWVPSKVLLESYVHFFFFPHKHGSLQELHAFKKLVFSKNIWASIRGRIYSILVLPLFPHYFSIFLANH
jgi:hypothetical protein